MWPSKRLRFLTLRKTSPNVRSLLDGCSEVPFLAMRAIGERGEIDLSETRSVDEVRTGYTLFADGDVVVAKITPCFENGKGALIRGTMNGVGFGTTELYVLTPGPEIDGRFLYYLTVDRQFRKLGEAYMVGAAGQQRVPVEFIRDTRVPIPSLSQQRVIADYLDRETGRLDSLTAEKVRLLSLLEDKRQALIVRAVTRGLNPDGPFRPAGLPWLDEIPQHWEIWKLGHLASVGNGSTPSRSRREYWEAGTIPWLNSSSVNEGEITKVDQFVTKLAVQECHLPMVESGAVLVAITGQGKIRGRAALLSIDATINQHVAFISARTKVSMWYLRWLLHAAYGFLRSISDDIGGTKGALTCEELTNLRVPVPPCVEQRKIVRKISTELRPIDELIDATEHSIILLKERRAALISNALFGQIDMENGS